MLVDRTEESPLTKKSHSDKKEMDKRTVESFLRVEGRGANKEKVDEVKEVAEITKEEVNHGSDFYERLRTVYNKPFNPTSKKEKIVTNPKAIRNNAPSKSSEGKLKDKLCETESLTANIKKFLHKYPKFKTEKPQTSTFAGEKINYNRNIKEDVDCKTACYEEAKFKELKKSAEMIRKLGGIDEDYTDSDGNDPDNKFPSLEDLPDDHAALEELFLKSSGKMKEQLSATEDSAKSTKEYEGGTEESVKSFVYRMENMLKSNNLTEAVVGVQRCSCPDTLVIDGDTAGLQEIKKAAKELRDSHRVGTIIVRLSKGDYTVDDAVDDKMKVKKHKGPALLTRYALERLCGRISKHPCLGRLVMEYLPLSRMVQALLVPAFANLTSLRLVGTKLNDDGVTSVCQYLWRSKNLSVIDFSDNLIKDTGAEKVAKLLSKRALCKVAESGYYAIERISLNNNPIGLKGLRSLLKVLNHDMFLMALDLRDCDIETTAEEVLDGIERNFALQVLDLTGNRVDRLDLIVRRILENCTSENTKYKWEDEEEIKKYY